MTTTSTTATQVAERTVFPVLFAACFCHLLNDLMQSLLPATYPQLKDAFHLSFTQVGLVTLAYQVTGSLFQPLVGFIGDRRPRPYLLPFCMVCTGLGLCAIAYAPNYDLLLAGASLMGLGSAIFHPESSRVSRLGSGGRHGLAQSLFQVGGNAGSALGPLMAAFVVAAYGRHSLSWLAVMAALGFTILWQVGTWHARHGAERRATAPKAPVQELPRAKVILSMTVLLLLVFSKYAYLSSITSYYTFYLIERFGMSTQDAQLHLFVFLGAVAVGTFAGGPIGDRIGRKRVIWVSILGVLPFTLALPFADLAWTTALSAVIGLVLASAFSAIVVFGQELMPRSVGMVAGLMFGFSFGVGGLAAAVLGKVADVAGIETVYRFCSFLPLLGLLTVLLPDLRKPRVASAPATPPALEP
jgi:FSR family fosmidomycin resistance protein-like MFS transporter